MSIVTTDSKHYENIAEVIRHKSGDTALYKPSEMAEVIRLKWRQNNKETIDFIDYDGTIVESWSIDELENKTELPPNPSHPGLISQGWNWSLEDIKSHNRSLVVGQMYITDNGSTRLHINIDSSKKEEVKLYYIQSISCGVTVDWGDGSDVYIPTALDNIMTHEYEPGCYVIELTPIEGCNFSLNLRRHYDHLTYYDSITKTYRGVLQIVNFGVGCEILGGASATLTSVTIPKGITAIINSAFQLCYSIQSVTIPDGVHEIGSSAFSYMPNLIDVSLPNGITRIPDYTFRQSYSLSRLTIPDSAKSIGIQAFYFAASLEKMIIPDGVEILANNSFAHCCKLSNITIPDSVQSFGESCFYSTMIREMVIPRRVVDIGTNAFYNGYLSFAVIPDSIERIGDRAFTSLRPLEFHFQGTTPPTLEGSSVFQALSVPYKIYVPASAINEYKSATNWSMYASKIVAEP